MKIICDAMKEAGITDPESMAGIEFCLDCPYPSGCIVLEDTPEKTIERAGKVNIAKFLSNRGKNNKEIAEILGVSRRTVQRYLRRLR